MVHGKQNLQKLHLKQQNKVNKINKAGINEFAVKINKAGGKNLFQVL